MWLCESVVLWQKKPCLTLAITFKPSETGTSYLAYILNLWNPFKWHQGKWSRDLDRDLHTKNSQFWTLLQPGNSFFTNTSVFSTEILILWVLRIHVSIVVLFYSVLFASHNQLFYSEPLSHLNDKGIICFNHIKVEYPGLVHDISQTLYINRIKKNLKQDHDFQTHCT